LTELTDSWQQLVHSVNRTLTLSDGEGDGEKRKTKKPTKPLNIEPMPPEA
jgi:hypothetical protein